MSQPIVSVIIPAYNAADHLGEAIQSVLDQTFTDFEIIVVNDASPDNTTEIVESFNDPRLKYVIHKKNRGLSATRNTGVQASTGQYLALLDHDDVFHREKLMAHVRFLENHPQIGVTYNSRFEVTQSIKTIREIWRAPRTVNLADLVLGYPFAPSDIVIRREWLLRIGLFDESNPFHGEDLNTNCRLALAGCQFALVDRVLNFRRNHPARIRKNLDASLRNVFHNLDTIFADPRCPDEVRELRDLAYANNNLVWAYWTMAQDETELGQGYLREAIRLKPSILDGEPCELLHFLITYTIDDERGNLADSMKRIFDQLPSETAAIAKRYDWALARGYLLKGTRDIIWDRPEDGHAHFARAAELRAEVDESFVQLVTHQLMGYEQEFGTEATRAVIRKLAPYLMQVGGRRSARRLKGCYSVNQAFQSYHAGDYGRVPGRVTQAVINDPSYLLNRGILSILMRSIAHPRLGLDVR